MSYVPYSPDVVPPNPGDFTPPPRAKWPWVAGAVFVAAVALFFWWNLRTRPITEPLARIALADGTELRVVAAQTGGTIKVSSDETYGGRVRWSNDRRGSSSTSWGMSNAAILIVTKFDPATGVFMRPAIKNMEIIESSGTVLGFPSDQNYNLSGGGNLPPVQPLPFPVVPRRDAQIHLRFDDEGRPVDATIPNPFLIPNAPTFTAKPLPQHAEVDGVVIEFNGATVGKSRSTVNGIERERDYISANMTTKFTATPESRANNWAEFFDATGNRASQGLLPSSERVWGVKVTVSEGLDFPFPPDRLIALGKFKVPAAAQGQKLPVPPQLAAAGIREILLLGPGTYAWAGGQLTATVEGKSEPVVKIKHPGNGNCGSRSGPALVFFGTSQNSGPDPLNGQLRMRWGTKFAHSLGSGYSGNGTTVERYHSDFAPSGETAPPAGEEVEIEIGTPKPRTAEFYFDRPKLPGE